MTPKRGRDIELFAINISPANIILKGRDLSCTEPLAFTGLNQTPNKACKYVGKPLSYTVSFSQHRKSVGKALNTVSSEARLHRRDSNGWTDKKPSRTTTCSLHRLKKQQIESNSSLFTYV